MWNEPDVDSYWAGTPAEYVQLLRVSYLSAKAANPEAQVILAGWAYWPNGDFLKQVLDDIAADPQARQHNDYFDISAWHWYTRASDLYDKVIWARNLMQAHGFDKPLWVNETNVVRQSSGFPPAGAQWAVSPDEQAAFIVQASANALAAGADKVFFFRLEDTLLPDGVGLLTHDQVPYPAYAAMQSVAEFLRGAAPRGRRSENGITQVAFQRADGQLIFVIWNETAIAQSISIPVNTPLARVAYPDRRVQVETSSLGYLRLVLPPATVTSGETPDDRFVGGRPVFVLP
jgi:hypothetical protein